MSKDFIEVQETYSLPFDSEFDWRVTFVSLINEFARDAATEIISKYPEDKNDLEWKDEEGIIRLAFEEDLFKKFNDVIVKKADDFLNVE